MTTRVARAAARMRGDLALLTLDVALTAGAYFALLVMRFDGRVPERYWQASRVFVVAAVAIHLFCNWAWGLYGQMWRHASVAEARRVCGSGMSASALILVLFAALERTMPLSVIILGGATSTMVGGAVRFHSRLFAFRRHEAGRSGLRVVVVGAGEAGAALVREMGRNPSTGLVPVAVVDDDPRKQGRNLLGVPIAGGIDELASVAKRAGAHQVVLAVAAASAGLVRRVADSANQAGVALKILPGVDELLGGRASVRDVRDLRIDDLLGRREVETDLEAVRQLLAGRRVLITGAGGSIGSEIARQVATFEPALLILLDRDETHLYDAAAPLAVEAVQALADICDRAAIAQLMRRHRPEVVFHAAANKHVPLLEEHPCEAITNNVVGTWNLVEEAQQHGVDRFVFISTDKAVRPSSVMGASKRIGEYIVTTCGPQGGKYCAVRFGNVLGSRGSVIPTFARQIAAGGPVTVTHPEMTRYFMTVGEAVQLVLQAAAFAEGSDLFMLEMGEAMNIYDMAQRMIRLSGRVVGTDIAIRITGIRAGEKLVEELREPWEDAIPTTHPAIIRLEPDCPAPALVAAAVARLAQVAGTRQPQAAATLLHQMAAGQLGALIDLTAIERSNLLAQGARWSQSST
ncbi:MAG: polysaccharide biosynthesis protein [Acidimicrobiales bacterium]